MPLVLQCLIIAAPLGVQAVTRRDAENPSIGIEEGLFRQDLLQELDDTALFVGPQIVRLVEDEEDARRFRFQAAQVFKLDFGDRRIGRDHEEGRIAFREYLQGRFRIVPQCRPDAGGVDDHRPVGKDVSRIKQVDSLDAKPVFRIGLLGDETKQDVADFVGRVNGKLLVWRFAPEVNDDERLATPGNEGGDSGQRNDPGRQDIGAEQRVDERALTALELAENGELQAFMLLSATQHAQSGEEQRFRPDGSFERRLDAAERRGERSASLILMRSRRHLCRRGHGGGFVHALSPSSIPASSSSSPVTAGSASSTNDSCPILASCARSQDRMSPRWPLIGRAQRRFFKALLSSPAHQYSLITINDQPWRPERVKVKISMASPCLGPVTLCRSRSNWTPSCVQCDRFRPGLVRLSNRSNSLKKDGWAKFFTARAPSKTRRRASGPARLEKEGPYGAPTARYYAAGVISPKGAWRGTPSPSFEPSI